MKPFWKSKTLWANAAAVGLVVGKHFGFNVPELSVEQIAFVNILLRFVTKESVGV